MRFQDAAPDARAATYARIQADPLVHAAAEALLDASLGERVMARAVMNGETLEPDGWRTCFPTLFGPTAEDATRAHAERVLGAVLAIAERGAGVRDQYRGALVEELTARLLARRAGDAVKRERRILFDGVRAEIHPYDVTVERAGAAEAHDCKWGARGVGADVLHQLDDAHQHAAEEDERLTVGLVVFDAALSCLVRLDAQTAPSAGIDLVTIETLDTLARPRTGASR
ncbi:MAG: hypothetical protein KF809_08405 [Chloroflexi bacterium]|nr:hypothetical protein [Chloroflexota bacterium]